MASVPPASVPPVWRQCRPASVRARCRSTVRVCVCVSGPNARVCSIHSLCSFLLEPRGRVRVAWDVLVFVCLVYLLVSMPYRIGFDVPGACGT